MNLFAIAWKSVKQRWLSSSLTAFSVSLGVMLMVCVLVILGIVRDAFTQNSIGYHLIVGPKGSDLQLVLSSVYRISPPIENIPYKLYEEIKGDERVSVAIPICLGDFTEEGGFPIVGTTPEYFSTPYQPGRQFLLKGPARDRLKQFDAIIGAQVARVNDWAIGDTFRMIHGGTDTETSHVHDEEFTIAGILAPTGTPNDKTVFVMLEGFYAIAGHDRPIFEALEQNYEYFGQRASPDDPNHDPDEQRLVRRYLEMKELVEERTLLETRMAAFPPDDELDSEQETELAELLERVDEIKRQTATPHWHDPPAYAKEVTAVFVRMAAPPDEPAVAIDAAFNYSDQMKNGLKAQAINPIIPMQRLTTSVVGNVEKVLYVITVLIIVVSGVGIFVSIYNSMADRRREIAVMRALGAQRATVFAIILAEAMLLCVGGGMLGIALGHGAVFVAAPFVEAASGLLIDPLAGDWRELVIIPVLIVLATLIGIVPGLTAYRTDVARALAE